MGVTALAVVGYHPLAIGSQSERNRRRVGRGGFLRCAGAGAAALTLVSLAGGCRRVESGPTALPRESLVRLGGVQVHAPCVWPEPTSPDRLRAPTCGEGTAREGARAPNRALEIEQAIASSPDERSRALVRLATAKEARWVVLAIQELKRARAEQLSGADLDGDLAASFLRLAELDDDAYSLFFALERLLAAVSRHPDDDTLLFNRGVAWELAGVTTEAEAAWRAYLVRDGDSPWAAEARDRLARLRSSRGPAFEEKAWAPTLLAAGRERIFETSLPGWAEAVLAGDATADDRLAEADAIARATGDRLAGDGVAIVRGASPAGGPARVRALASAHLQLAAGIRYRRTFDLERAVSTLAGARERLAALGSPATLLADYHAAMAVYHADRYPEAWERLTAVAAAADARDEPLLAGLARKSLGTIAQVTGRPDDARKLFLRALADVRRAGDLREGLNVECAVADGLLAVGEDREAWRAIHGALHAAWQHPDDRARHVVAAYGAAMAEKRGFVHLATAMTRLSLAAIEEGGAPAAVADSATWYAASLVAQGDIVAASETLRGIRPLLEKIADPETSRRAVADLDCAEGRQLLAVGQPAAARPRLKAAADYYAKLPEPLLTLAVPCRAAEGQSALALGERLHAIEVLEEALRMASRLDGFLPRPEALYGSGDPTSALLESVLALQLERGLPWEALRLAALALQRRTPRRWGTGVEGSALASGVADADGAAPLVAAASRLAGRGRVVVVAYALPHGVVTWRLDGTSIAVHRAAMAQAELLAAAERFVLALRHGHPPAAATPEAARLHELLLGSLLRDVPPNHEVVVVATPELAGLPWAFLEEPASGAPLVARWAIASAPDLEVALEPSVPVADEAGEMLVVANPATPADYQFPRLPSAEREASELSMLFDGVPTVLVAEAATREAVGARILRAVSVHFGVHGIADTRAPGASFLLLRGEGGGRAPLTAAAILDMDLRRMRLAVLAACDSSLRSTTLAASTYGLGETFLAAGARSVIASGWAVDDEETSRFMVHLYRGLAAGQTVGDALRAAQLEAHAAHTKGRPRGYAAFRLLGDPSVTLDFIKRRRVS